MADLNLTVTIPDDKLTAVIDALAVQNGWTETIENEDGNQIPNPKTKGQWIKDWILGVVRASWKAYNDADAKRTALDAQDEDGSDFG